LPGSTTRALGPVTRSQGPFPPPALPSFNGRMTLSDSRRCCRLQGDVEAATLAPNGPPPVTRTTFPTCRAYYPGESSGCSRRLLPRSRGIPQMAGGSASALSACSGFTIGPSNRSASQKRPLSRGSNPCGYPHEPLVSYRIESTTLRVDPSSTDDSRLRGALPTALGASR
jgi:hypothetical protein